MLPDEHTLMMIPQQLQRYPQYQGHVALAFRHAELAHLRFLQLAAQWSSLAESTKVRREGLAIIELGCEAFEFAFQCPIEECSH